MEPDYNFGGAAPSNFQKTIGYRLVDWRQDYARLEMPVSDHHLNRGGVPHGGVYATLLDTVMGFAGCYRPEGETPILAFTISLSTHFVSRPKGRLLIADGKMLGGGAKIFFAEGVLKDETGALIAKGSASFKSYTQ